METPWTLPELVKIQMFSLNLEKNYYEYKGYYLMPVVLVDWSQVHIFENGTVIHCYNGVVMPIDWSQVHNVFSPQHPVVPLVSVPSSNLSHQSNHPQLRLFEFGWNQRV